MRGPGVAEGAGGGEGGGAGRHDVVDEDDGAPGSGWGRGEGVGDVGAAVCAVEVRLRAHEASTGEQVGGDREARGGGEAARDLFGLAGTPTDRRRGQRRAAVRCAGGGRT